MEPIIPQKAATMHYVAEDLWDSSSQPHVAQALEGSARRSMSKLGEVVSDLHRQVRYETPLDGYDAEGNKLPPMVAVYFSAYVLPNEEN